MFGAENPPSAEFCESCGVKIETLSIIEGTEVDKLLEELTEISPEEAEEEKPGAEKELVDELLDSLLVEGAPPEEAVEFECPLCGTPLAEDAEVCEKCGARFTKERRVPAEVGPPPPEPEVEERPEVPVSVSVTEEEVSKIRMKSGRLIDLTMLGTIIALLAIFVLGGMYDADAISNNPSTIIIFIVVAIIGVVIGYMLLRISTSAIAQGDKLVKEGSYQEAIYYYDRAIRMGSKPSSGWASKGVALKRLGRYEEALRCQNIALKIDDENEIAWCNKGDVYFKLGDLKKAIDAYNKAIKLKTKYAIAWNNKGAALAMAKRFKEAKECHDTAVRLKPKYVAAWLNRGEVLARLGQREEAAKCLDRAKALGA